MRNIMFSSTLMDEVMAQPFYPTDDEVSFISQSKHDALSIPHTIQSDHQQEIVDRNLSCINSGNEIEAKGRGPTRRRIPLACLRCRKRKIRCSGDAGDSRGCSNCRGAGNTQCQFLRVNSSILQTKVPPSNGSECPYPPNEMASQRMGMYAASKMEPSNHRIPPFSRAADYEVTSDPQNPYGRQPFAIDSTINYEDDSSTTYNVQSSSTYMLPSSPQVFMADYGGIGWNSKGWGAGLQAGRATGEAMFAENDAENPLTHQAYPYVISGHGAPENEAISMGRLPASLTSSIQGTERTLPNPAGRNALPGNNTGPSPSTDDLHGLPTNHGYKSSHRWIPRCETRTPMQPTSNVSYNTSTVSRAKLIPTSAQDMIFGYLPVASSNASSSLIPSPGAFTSLEATTCVTEAADEFRGHDSRIGNFSRGNRRMVSLSEYSPDTYGYSRRSYRNNHLEVGDSSAENTLITGLPYMRPKLPQMVEVSGYKTSADIHPPPVSALTNPGGI
ncbi:hypothetical protein BDW59DRAFT_82372 [Aspergillus cavernicola]|uniref:Zn(2)-C6 fungal-type domain-containing protein n=1 Tax=Aspergillus cavernicola TaxID=176166 RepID=A0ABR4IAJ0_9EURO